MAVQKTSFLVVNLAQLTSEAMLELGTNGYGVVDDPKLLILSYNADKDSTLGANSGPSSDDATPA